jgi:hypothetical protein
MIAALEPLEGGHGRSLAPARDRLVQQGGNVRVFACLSLGLVSSGCSFLDELALSDGYRLDPNKIYLGRSRISVSVRDTVRYACVGAPMLCEQHGSEFDCRCP